MSGKLDFYTLKEIDPDVYKAFKQNEPKLLSAARKMAKEKPDKQYMCFAWDGYGRVMTAYPVAIYYSVKDDRIISIGEHKLTTS
ncbi:hypothetical protein VF04_36690 [Nostoc linckia z7]|uniref:Uncharacterized protein n=1 Tax=Nostoc linckia z7 TaxID=1628745 RepID=A0ABX4KHD5_NOSLI|nr:hypothetical protein [Nostoc linckia]PHJ59310.1 hypothetical protein VF05_32485 [Nostoc linckia z3]PHJ63635.1 hypothetical protein VF03_29995 [Nostoc linckia z2]PHJ70006.1 hypothetical protein VF06_37815 [Nostoc linckia z4]PHJ83471.1 hypothetical protein VF04_36690 [Nostoc linckia z7]